MNEEWRDVTGFEGWYQVSNLGRVKRIRKVHWNHGKKNIVEREHILKPTPDRKGYSIVIITNGETKKHAKVHRLVAEAFIPNPQNKSQVDHINRIVDDNRVENLRWVNNSENQINSSSNRMVKCFGENLTLSQWGEKTGIKPTTIRARLERGWKPEDALSIPVLEVGKKIFRR